MNRGETAGSAAGCSGHYARVGRELPHGGGAGI